jgi:hypothetical protein
MPRLLLLVIVLCAGLTTGAPAAHAATTRITEVMTVHSIAEGAAQTYAAGDLVGTLDGAVLIRQRLLSGDGGKGTRAAVTFTMFTASGSLRARGTLWITKVSEPADPGGPNAGSLEFSGRARFLSGTGRYGRASGSMTFRGVTPDGETYLKISARGTIRTP